MSEWTTDFDSIDESRLHWVTFKSGNVTVLSGHAAKSSNAMQGGVVAVMPMDKPAPYQPPKPKRREFLDYKMFPRNEEIHVREVLPGDPDPDEAIELKRRCEEVAGEIRKWLDYAQQRCFSSVDLGCGTLAEWGHKLRGETEAKQC